ncbi:MAG: tetratricopeptide repeat protein [Candidatus Hydrogenedentota bacterium]
MVPAPAPNKEAVRLVWRITSVIVVLSAFAVVFRGYLIGDSGEMAFEEAVGTMLALYDEDPQARRPATRVAIEQVARVAEEAPENAPAAAYFAQGVLLEGQERLGEAEEAYREAIARDPEWSRAYYGLGVVLHKQEQVEEAEAYLRQAIALAPEWSRAHNGLAILLRMNGRMEAARERAKRAVELAPNSVASRNNYGNLLLRLERYEEAAKEYRTAISVAPDHPAPYYNLACVRSLQGNHEEACDYLEQAIALDAAFREQARGDGDFDAIRDEPEFRALVYGNNGED